MRQQTHFDLLPESLRPQTDVPVGKLEWRKVPEYPDYEICTMGLVRRIRKGARGAAEKILKPSLSDGIYPTVELYNERGGRTERIHILLAKAFVRAPRPGELVRHLDGRPQIPTAWTVGYGFGPDNARDRRHHSLASHLSEPSERVLSAACATVEMLLLGATIRKASERWKISQSKAAKLRVGLRHSAELQFLHEVIARLERTAAVDKERSEN